ncbi:hypothetical protein LPB142_11615 [Rhodobacter xanthinilyticus]|uniref:Chemotaxis protein n=1 Tax=Rhodobacter xanthinilyticus TaxID=1850250 RepID=A0A1D9MDN9_9RHOB|nr:methyl-accepting chemotaxis protein [Rhodobacter xanthinilyticus]AOZ69890.1 hypothetical protein LPB142_11615 [Rhodobacter xanthinilyticus]
MTTIQASLPFYRSVFFKTLMMTFAATIFAATSLGIANYRSARATAVLEAREHVAALTPLIARQISGALRFSKAEPADDAFKALIADSDGEGLGAIALLADGTVLAEIDAGGAPAQLKATAATALSTQSPARSPDELTYAIPVKVGETNVGAIAIAWSDKRAIAVINAQLLKSIAITTVIALISQTLIGWALHRGLARPLTRVNGAMARVSAQDYALTIPETGRQDEIGAIARSLSAFRDDLAASEEANRLALIRGAALSAGTTAFMLTDNDHRITYMNAAMRHLLHKHAAALRELQPGFDPETLLGTRADQILPSAHQTAAPLDGGATETLRLEQELASGALTVLINPVFDADGGKIGHVSEWLDVTESRQNAAILEAMDTTQVRAEFTADGKLLQANALFCKMLGAPLDTLRMRDFAPLLRDAGGSDAIFARLARGDQIVGPLSLERAPQPLAHLDAVFGPIRDRSGTVIKQVLLGTDITEIVEERTRIEAARAADQADQRNVIDTLRAALEHLSEGDLTRPIDTVFPGEYETLRQDFNRATATLRSAMQSVLEKADSIRSETGQISHAAEDLSRRTEQQAATLEETAAALNELTASVVSAAEGAKRANEMVSQAKKHAETSGEVVHEAVLAMGEIEQSSNKISRITGVIDEIAFQTNLLALNAGVEAARAGEAGRGFAVVASEVRALAQRSSDAAREIASLISSSSTQVKRGVELVGQAGETLNGIQTSVADIYTTVADIAGSTSEQSAGLAEINTAVNQLDQVTQQNAAMFEQTSAAHQSLLQEADSLGTTMARFRLGAPGAAAPLAMPAPPPARASAPHLKAVASARKPAGPNVAPQAEANPPIAFSSVRRNSAARALKPVRTEDDWEDF